VNLAIQIRILKKNHLLFHVRHFNSVYFFVTENLVPYINDLLFQLLSLRIKSSLIDLRYLGGDNNGGTAKQIHGSVPKFRSAVSCILEGWQHRFHKVH
jgi:hypothetical protein